MFANSSTLILLSIVIGLPPLLILFWAIRKGHFDDVGRTAYSIFEENELQYTRPWENQEQAKIRIDQHGAMVKNPSSEWERWL